MSPSPPAIPRPAQIQELGPVRAVRMARPARPGWAGRPDDAEARRPAVSAPPPIGMSPLKALEGVLLLLPFLLLPLLALWFAGRPVLVEHSSLDRYRSISAVVVQTGIEPRANRDALRAAAFVPRVTFRYVVGGRTYQANRVTPLDVSGTERWARKHVAAYRPGDVVTAYYDPQGPDHAFLERPATGALSATFFLPVPLLALALLWAAHLSRKQRAAAAARQPLRLVR